MARRTDGVSGVFDDLEIVLMRDVEKAIHVAGMAGEMDRQQGAHALVSAALQRFLDPRRTEVEGAGFDVYKNRPDTEIAHHFGGRRKRERRRDYFIAGAQPQSP